MLNKAKKWLGDIIGPLMQEIWVNANFPVYELNWCLNIFPWKIFFEKLKFCKILPFIFIGETVPICYLFGISFFSSQKTIVTFMFLINKQDLIKAQNVVICDVIRT